MYGEPSASEYGKMLSEANKTISTMGFKCTHNNLGWCGYFITTPNGFNYQLIKRSGFGPNKSYYLAESTPTGYDRGMPVGTRDFKDLEDCKQYLLENGL